MVSPPRPDEDPLSFQPLILLTLFGVFLQWVLLVLSGEPELQSDEANYVYLALIWTRFGVYLDQHRYLWPPGYTWYLGWALEHFGDRGLFVARLGQVLASASVGLTAMLLGYRLFGMRAARLTGLLWALYLPLAVFAHLLWNETLFLALFLPAIYQLVRVVAEGERIAVDRRLIAAGVCLGLGLLLKEAPYYLVPLLGLLLFFHAPRKLEGLRRASLLLGTVLVILLPWGLRNREVYGRFVPAGASLGENVFNGLNAEYKNFDLEPLDTERDRRDQPRITDQTRAWFVAIDEEKQWERAEEVLHTIDRSAENTRRGLAFARENPGWLVRSRIKKAADLFTPMSFFTRHLALGHYDSSLLGSTAGRRLTGVWAVAITMLVLFLGLRGWIANLERGKGASVLNLVIGYSVATSLLVAMSRFRAPFEPLFIVFAAGAISRVHRPIAGARRALLLGAWALLIFLWWVNWPEVRTVFAEMVWRRA